MSLQAKICLSVGALVLLSGILVGFGILAWYVALWSKVPGWSSLLTVTVVLVGGLFFDKTRRTAGKILFVGICLFVLFWMAVFATYGWYVFFTTGLNIESKFPLIISRPGGALIIAGIVMLIVCGCIHFMDGESFSCRVAAGIGWGIMATASALFLLTMFSAPMITPVVTRELTSGEISTLEGCEVSEGSTRVRCFLPEAAKQGADR
jgi:hypothetical protein